MADTPLAQRLQVKPGRRLFVTGDVDDGASVVGPLPDDASTAGSVAAADVVLLFARDQASLAARWPAIAVELVQGSLVWIAYPKRTGAIATDFTRDRGWAPVIDAGFDPVSQIAVDDTWSALRFTRDPALRARRAARGARVGGR